VKANDIDNYNANASDSTNDNDYAYASDNANDNDNASDNDNSSGFVGRSRVSCFSLDYPRPWPEPFRWAGAQWRTFSSLGENIACSTKGV
jgi:hypothetical protein